MSFATRLATALAEANEAVRQSTIDILTTFNTALADVQTTYASPAREVAAREDRVLEIALSLADQMAGVSGDLAGALLTEASIRLNTESVLTLRTEQ